MAIAFRVRADRQGWSQACRQHCGFELPRYGSEAVLGWHKMVAKSDAPTTYRVVVAVATSTRI